MNSIFLSSLAAFFHKVTCPKCKRDQFISRGASRKSFRCKYCGHIFESPRKNR